MAWTLWLWLRRHRRACLPQWSAEGVGSKRANPLCCRGVGMVCQLQTDRVMRPQPDLSIVIPAFNEQGRLEPTLRAYLDYCRRQGRSVEILVVDDGSTDATTALVERVAGEFPEIRLIRLPQGDMDDATGSRRECGGCEGQSADRLWR